MHAHVNLVAAYTARGAFEKAAEHYRRALALAPNQPENHYNYGMLLLAQSRELEAIEAFRQALANDPTYVDAHNNLGYLLARAGRTDEAIRELRAALQRNPAHRDAHFNLARALQASEQREEAIRHFLAATQVEDDKTRCTSITWPMRTPVREHCPMPSATGAQRGRARLRWVKSNSLSA